MNIVSHNVYQHLKNLVLGQFWNKYNIQWIYNAVMGDEKYHKFS